MKMGAFGIPLLDVRPPQFVALGESSSRATTTTMNISGYFIPMIGATPAPVSTTTVQETNNTSCAVTKQGPPMHSGKDMVSSDEDLDEPSLRLSDASDSFASMDDFLSWADVDDEGTDEDYRPATPRSGVMFHPHVEVREYSLTVGDHPFCDDPYPLSLDWSYARPYLRHIDDSKSRGLTYTPGPRLCVEMKRRRLAEVRGCSETDVDEMIRSPYELVALGRLFLSYMFRLLRTVASTKLERYELDDEYLFLYAGIKNNSGTRPAKQVLVENDLEAGFY